MTYLSATGTAVATLSATAVSVLLTERCRRLALRHGVTDQPGGHKAHAVPTPYLGGVALVVATLVPALVGAVVLALPVPVILLYAAAMSVFAIGLADDLLPLGLLSRLGVEAIAAVLVVLGGTVLDLVGHRWLDAVLTVAWIVLITNSFNLLDNMDAAAASMGVATAVALGVALAGGGFALPLWCLAGGCAGFLWHNRPPARIFMGDAGSLFIGFVVAVGAVAVAPAGPAAATAALVLFGFGPIVDTVLVVTARWRAGRSWRTGGTDHVSHRLRRLGLSPTAVAGVLAAAVALSGLAGVLLARSALPPVPALVVVVGAGLAVVVLLHRVPTDADRVRVTARSGRGG